MRRMESICRSLGQQEGGQVGKEGLCRPQWYSFVALIVVVNKLLVGMEEKQRGVSS